MFGEALAPQKIEPRYEPTREVLGARPAAGGADAGGGSAPAVVARDPFAEQLRLVRRIRRPDHEQLRQVEYELFRDQLYRIRWQFAERFERPWMAVAVTHLTAEFGKPYYDQLIEAKFGSGRSTLRRAAWRRGDRTLELRQLNPLVGGPMFLTLSDLATIRAIVASGGTAAPEPDSIGTWWQEPLRISAPLSGAEQAALLAAFRSVVAQIDWGP